MIQIFGLSWKWSKKKKKKKIYLSLFGDTYLVGALGRGLGPALHIA